MTLENINLDTEREHVVSHNIFGGTRSKSMHNNAGRSIKTRARVNRFCETENSNDIGLLLCFCRCMIQYGQVILAVSYSIGEKIDKISYGEISYVIHCGSKKQVLYNILQLLIWINLSWRTGIERAEGVGLELMTWIKRLGFLCFVFEAIIVHTCLRLDKNLWIAILEHADEVQKCLCALGVAFMSKRQAKGIAVSVCLFGVVGNFLHVMSYIDTNNATGLTKYADYILEEMTGRNSSNLTSADNPVLRVVTTFGFLLLQLFGWGIIYFTDVIRLIFGLVMFYVFVKLNSTFVIGQQSVYKMDKILEAHFKATKLLRLINQLISPITFVAVTHFVCYSCYWIHIILLGTKDVARYLIFIHFVTRNVFINLISASVNSKAHEISDWLENLCADTPSIQCSDSTRLMLLSARVYNKDAIGFKGLSYFTISGSFLTAVLGLIVTYTILILQFTSNGLLSQPLNDG